MFFKNFKNKLLMILLITIFSIPSITYAYSNELIIGGENIGIEVKSDKVLIVGFYNVGQTSPGKDAGLKIGDKILKVDDTVIHGITDLSKYSKDTKNLKITYERGNKIYETTLNLKKENNIYKTGLYVKDSIIGIGTLTFIDPETNRYGALGHEIVDQTTGTKFEITKGKIFKSTVTGIDKAERGEVGEKNANYDINKVYGTIDKNSITGIYGTYKQNYDKTKTKEVSAEIKKGEAEIITVLNEDKKQIFKINIISIDKNHETKNILFEVIDKELLKKGNGIVQGMSGSPIVQNNKIIGAVTHVVVDDPHKGYGILITNMLKESGQ